MNQKEQLVDIALLRCFATFSLVVWHSYCPYICWDIADTPLNSIYTALFTRLIPSANMPLFTILAGYLFSYLYREKKKYKDFKVFLFNKTKRLLIPFFILGTLISLLEYGKDLTDFLYGTPNHLWYCLMLFYVFIICWLVETYLNSNINILLGCLSLVVVSLTGPGALSIQSYGGLFLPVYYYGYFVVGFIFRKYQNNISFIDNKWPFLASTFIYIASVAFNRGGFVPIVNISYFLMLFYFVNFDSVKSALNKEKSQSIILLFSKLSFGIYVFHQWIIWNLTREPACLSYLQPILERHFIIAPIMMVLLVFTISSALTYLSLKTKIGRFLLL